MIRLRLLGPAEIEGPEGGTPGVVLRQPSRLALLTFLALHRPRGLVRRDALLAMFWPHLDQERARGALRQALFVLRKRLGRDVVVTRGSGEVGLAEDRFWCDALAFDAARQAGQLADALSLYRGELLAAFHFPSSQEFEVWLEEERDRLRRGAVEAVAASADAAASAGSLDEAVRFARTHTTLAPADEGAASRLVRFLALAGARTEALAAYDDFVRRLQREYEIDPSSGFMALAADVRAGRIRPPGVATRSSPGPGAGGAPPTPRESASPPASRGAAVAPRPPEARAPRPSLYPGGVLLLATAAALSALALWGSQRANSRNPELEFLTVAVFPFAVQGDPAYSYLSEGMVDLLSTRLDGAGVLRAVDPGALLAAVRGASPSLAPEATRALARRLGASLYVTGNVVEAGGRLSVSAWVRDVAGALLETADGIAEGEADLFDLVDRLARELLAKRLGGTEHGVMGLAARTTSSLPALKAYLSAERDHRAGQPLAALEHAGRAVALDPGFALAYYRLSVAANWMNDERVAQEAAEQAFAHAGRLGDADRLLLQAHRDQVMRRWEEAERGFRLLLDTRPEHLEAWFNLGETLFHNNPVRGKPIEEADAAFARVLELDPHHVPAQVHRTRLLALRGQLDEVASTLGRLDAERPVADDAVEVSALRALHPDFRTFARELTSGRPAVANGAVWNRAVFSGDLSGAEALVRVALPNLPSGGWRALFRVHLAHLDLARGRWSSARRELARAQDEDPTVGLEEAALVATLPFLPADAEWLPELRRELLAWDATSSRTPGRPAYDELHPLLRQYLIGMVEARLGHLGAALAVADSLDAGGGDLWPPGLGGAWAAGVRAAALHQVGRDADALTALRSSPWVRTGTSNAPALTLAHERFLLASLEAQAGEYADAARLFASFDHQRLYHLVFLAPAMWSRGAALERLGDEEGAAAAYARFLALWSGADPELGSLRAQAAAAVARVSGG